MSSPKDTEAFLRVLCSFRAGLTVPFHRRRQVQTVEVRTEEETDHGWRYHVFVQPPGAPPVEHIVLLSWVDHEHWSGGRFPPSRVVERVVQLLIEHWVEHEMAQSL
jgi:hypothetical protein